MMDRSKYYQCHQKRPANPRGEPLEAEYAEEILCRLPLSVHLAHADIDTAENENSVGDFSTPQSCPQSGQIVQTRPVNMIAVGSDRIIGYNIKP